MKFKKWTLFIINWSTCMPIFISLTCKMMKPHTKNELRLPFYYPKTASVFNTELTGKRLSQKSLPSVTCNPLLFRFCLILKSIFSSTNPVKDFWEGELVFKLLDFIYSPYFLEFSHEKGHKKITFNFGRPIYTFEVHGRGH